MVAACPFPARRGTPVRIERMAEALAVEGHEVHAVTYHLGEKAGPVGCEVHRIRDIGVYKDTSPGPNWRKLLLADPLLTARVMTVARRVRPDIIHAHHFEGLLAALPAARSLRIPVIFDAHVLLGGELQYYKLGLPRPLVRLVSKFLDGVLPRTCDHVVAVSSEIRDRLVEFHKLDPKSVTVVPNGVEPEFFWGRSGFFGHDGRPRLVFSGNLAAYQGVQILPSFLSAVLGHLPEARLVLVTSDDPAEILADAQSLGVRDNVDIVPANLETLADVLTSADVLLNPRTECPGVPLKLLNYMASGRPIVSFEGSARYLVDNESGLIIKNGDVEAFAQGVVRLIRDTALSYELGARARTFASNNLSWNAACKVLSEVYEGAIAGRTR
ncbi:MAG: glycosyltransferase family 4 protein [Steroidobacteraceae bacterium]